MLFWPLLLVPLLGCHADRKSDYLQPYKFVKPLADLGDLYRRAEDAAEDDQAKKMAGAKAVKSSVPAAAEDRTGLASPVGGGAEKPLMTTGLAAPEPLPQPTALKEARSRSRKKPADSEAKEEEEAEEDETGQPKEVKEKRKGAESAKPSEVKEALPEPLGDEEEDNMSNHNTELEGRALPPRPNAVKYRVPPKPEDEYYYYYDEYYEDYPDYRPYPGRPAGGDKKAVQQQQQPKTSERYPNFPPKPQQHQEKKRPPAPPPPAPLAEKPPKEKSGNRKPTGSSSKPPKELPRKEQLPPQVPRKSEQGDRKASSEPVDINSTLNRLKSLRKKQQSLPVNGPLPNPWEKFNAPPKQKPDNR